MGDKPLSAARTSLCLMESGTRFPSTFLLPRWCRGGVENVVWDMFSFNFLQPRVARRMSSGTRFSPTLFNPGSCRGGAGNVVWDAYVVWDAFFFNFPQPRASLLAEVFHF